MTSRKQLKGLICRCLQVWTSEHRMAVRWAAASLPANSQFLRPSTIGCSACSALSVANSDSRGGRGLKQAIAVVSPAIRVKVCERGRGCATPLCRSHPRQSGMTAKLVVKHLVVLELPFEIGLVPKPNPIQIFALDGSDQSLDESVRTWGAGNGLDLIDFEHPKVRSPAMKAKQRIVVRGKVPRQSLPCDRAVEHPADPDTVEIGCSDSEADDSAGEYIHHHHDPIALEQN